MSDGVLDKIVLFRLVLWIPMGTRWPNAVSSDNDILSFYGLNLRSAESSGDIIGSVRCFWTIQRRWIAGSGTSGGNCKEVGHVVVVTNCGRVEHGIIVAYVDGNHVIHTVGVGRIVWLLHSLKSLSDNIGIVR